MGQRVSKNNRKMVVKVAYFTSKSKELQILNILRCFEYVFIKYGFKYNFLSSRLIRQIVLEYAFHGIILIEKSECKNFKLINVDEDISSFTIGSHILLDKFSDSFFKKRINKLKNSHANLISENKVYTLQRHKGLGDSLSFLYGLDNFCTVNNIKVLYVTGIPLYKEIIEIFTIRHIKYLDTYDNPISLDNIFSIASWGIPWMKRFYESLSVVTGSRIKYIRPLSLRRLNVSEFGNSDIIVCQFDSRSSYQSNLKLIAKKILESFYLNDKLVILGGIDTKKYLGSNYAYELGDLNFIVNKLITCQYFIGSDSGIGHLAGLLGIKSYIFNFTDFEPVFHFFKEYNNTIIVPLDFINIKF
ncbi:MAG: hypothetical protein JO149_06455 [Gammaproteobacteria bacterium]|nr:hypothetical protein [Gammaproteobacteria bacterium]